MTNPYSQTLQIKAAPQVVFAYFVDPARLVRWMGQVARVDAVAGGEFSADINGVLIRGHYVALNPPYHIEIAWGEWGNAAMPPGSSRVTIDLEATETGTSLTLTHSGLPKVEAEKHAMGWPHFLGRLALCSGGLDPGHDPWAVG